MRGGLALTAPQRRWAILAWVLESVDSSSVLV